MVVYKSQDYKRNNLQKKKMFLIYLLPIGRKGLKKKLLINIKHEKLDFFIKTY